MYSDEVEMANPHGIEFLAIEQCTLGQITMVRCSARSGKDSFGGDIELVGPLSPKAELQRCARKAVGEGVRGSHFGFHSWVEHSLPTP